MAFNPFLSMNEPAAPVTTDVLNPFMMSDAEPAEAFTGDNPFAASNPFSDFGGGYEPPAGDTVPVDIFGTADPSGIGAKHFEETPTLNVFDSQPMENDKLVKPTELELVSTLVDSDFTQAAETHEIQPPARPLPPETQNLILSVTGQMEFTSTHLLDRIPPTRTPSPVSVRDIHSPSPTPEPDLLEDPVVIESTDLNRNKAPPARPPPARPPRPAPPSAPPPRPQAPPQIPQAPADDINLFDAPIPMVVKPTKEAILSLYSAPKKEEKPIDFLSDDIMENIPADTDMPPPNVLTTSATSVANEHKELLFNEAPASTTAIGGISSDTVTTNDLFSSSVNPMEDTSAPMDCTEPTGEEPSPVVPMNSSPFADDSDTTLQSAQVVESEKNPFETTDIDDNVTMLDNQNIFGMPTNDVFMTSQTDSQVNVAEDLLPQASSEITEMDAFTTEPVKSFDTAQSNIFDTNQIDISEEQASNLGWDTGEAMAQEAFPESQDAFDAFSAKFDSAPMNHMNTGKLKRNYIYSRET